ITILLILAVMTVSAVNLAWDTDRVRAGARQIQSYLAGARDRAIYAKAPRGVRFILDASSSTATGGPAFAVRSMVYVQPVEPWRLSIKDLTEDSSGDLTRFVIDASSGGNQTASTYLGMFDLIEK